MGIIAEDITEIKRGRGFAIRFRFGEKASLSERIEQFLASEGGNPGTSLIPSEQRLVSVTGMIGFSNFFDIHDSFPLLRTSFFFI